MQNQDILNFLTHSHMLGTLTGAKLSYAISKNKKVMMRIARDLQSPLIPSASFQKFESKRMELVKAHAVADENGDPTQTFDTAGAPTGFEILDLEVFKSEVDELAAEYKEVIDLYEGAKVSYNESLELESDFEPHMVQFSELPEGITQAQMDLIMFMVDEE